MRIFTAKSSLAVSPASSIEPQFFHRAAKRHAVMELDTKKSNHEAHDAFQTHNSSSGQSASGASATLRLDKETRTITLLPAEQLLREFLLECAQSFPGLEIWVTGGWIRDRLLGIPSSDLDLALSNLTGKEFGTFLEEYSAKPEVESRYSQKAAELGISGSLFTRFHIMEKNAIMSKKLETAGGRLFGLDVDLVNLRKEVYDGQTRNPDMEFGTAEEDAFRRDATVNALFYNLKHQQVADLTSRGLQDLDARIMTTPLDPMQTFMDDPLRVLRLIRVGSRLGFSIDPEAASCMRNTQIRRALDTIITRDRVGAELTKMMASSNPEAAFKCIFDFHLYAPIFVRLDAKLLQTLGQQFPFLRVKSSSPWPTTWPRAYELLAHVLHGQSNLSLLIAADGSTDSLWTMAAYSPLAGLRHRLLKETVQEAAASIKTTAKLTQLLESSLRNFDSIRKVVADVTCSNENCYSRSACGMAIRSWGATWTTQVAYVMLSEAVYDDAEYETGGGHDAESSRDAHARKTAWDKYSAFADFIFRHNLRNAHSLGPLLNGREIQELFGLTGGGKYLKEVMDKLVEWQFDNEDATKEQCEAWLLQQRDWLGVPQTV